MTSRGPFRPKTFYDSYDLGEKWSEIVQEHQKLGLRADFG